jgi:hypothetical protein
MLAAGALKAVEMMEAKPGMFRDLQNLAEELHTAFEDLPGLTLSGDRISPVKHLRLKSSSGDRDKDKRMMYELVKKVYRNGVPQSSCLLCNSHYI